MGGVTYVQLMDKQPTERLIHLTKEAYDGCFSTALLEQYKLYVQSADNVSARRVSSNRYLLTINTAVLALHGFQSQNLSPLYWAVSVFIIGAVISLLSCAIIRSHRNLNTAKFKLIHELERHLPAALYDQEWEIVRKEQGSTYWTTTRIESCIPFAFLFLHILVLIAILFFQ